MMVTIIDALKQTRRDLIGDGTLIESMSNAVLGVSPISLWARQVWFEMSEAENKRLLAELTKWYGERDRDIPELDIASVFRGLPVRVIA